MESGETEVPRTTAVKTLGGATGVAMVAACGGTMEEMAVLVVRVVAVDVVVMGPPDKLPKWYRMEMQQALQPPSPILHW